MLQSATVQNLSSKPPAGGVNNNNSPLENSENLLQQQIPGPSHVALGATVSYLTTEKGKQTLPIVFRHLPNLIMTLLVNCHKFIGNVTKYSVMKFLGYNK